MAAVPKAAKGATSEVPKVTSQGQELVDAARSGDNTLVNAILDLGANANCKDALGMTPLIAAVENGHISTMRILLEHGANPNGIGAGGSFPLRAASMLGDGEALELLLQSGAELDMETARGTALIAASLSGDVDTISLLVSHGATVDHETNDGLTPLIAAAREDRRLAVAALLKAGANPEYVTRDGVSALSVAEERTLQHVYSLLAQRAITTAADEALLSAEVRQEAQQKELLERSTAASHEAKHAAEAARVECVSKIQELKSESEDLLKKLGLSGQAGGKSRASRYGQRHT